MHSEGVLSVNTELYTVFESASLYTTSQKVILNSELHLVPTYAYPVYCFYQGLSQLFWN